MTTNAELLHLCDRIEIAMKDLDDYPGFRNWEKLKPLIEEAVGFLRGDLEPDGYEDELVEIQNELADMEHERNQADERVERLEFDKMALEGRIKELSGALSQLLAGCEYLGINDSNTANAHKILNPSQKAA